MKSEEFEAIKTSHPWLYNIITHQLPKEFGWEETVQEWIRYRLTEIQIKPFEEIRLLDKSATTKSEFPNKDLRWDSAEFYIAWRTKSGKIRVERQFENPEENLKETLSRIRQKSSFQALIGIVLWKIQGHYFDGAQRDTYIVFPFREELRLPQILKSNGFYFQVQDEALS